MERQWCVFILHWTELISEAGRFTANRSLPLFSKMPFISIFLTRFVLDLCQLDETEVCPGEIIKAAADKVALSGGRSWQPQGKTLETFFIQTVYNMKIQSFSLLHRAAFTSLIFYSTLLHKPYLMTGILAECCNERMLSDSIMEKKEGC